MSTVKDVFTRHQKAIYTALGIILIFAIIYALRSVLLPFIVGLILAYICLPLINWIERRLPKRGKYQQTKRVFLIILIYALSLGLLALLSYYIVTAIINASLLLINNAHQYVNAALNVVQNWLASFQEGFSPAVQQQINDILLNAASTTINAIEAIFSKGISTIPSTVSAILGFATLPIFLFYLMKDWEKLGKSLYSAFSPTMAKYIRGILSVIEGVLGRYIRAQLLLGFIVGYLCFMGLTILGIPFAPVLGILAFVTELIPVLGPWIGGIVAVIVTLATSPEEVIWVIILYLSVQLLENTLLVPRIQGGYLRVHPAVVLILLIVGAYLAGIWGMILAVPLVATIVELYKYLRKLNQLEESTPPPSFPDP